MTDQSNLSNFIWGTADLIRDTFTRGKYQDVILPFTVLRRIDCVLEATKEQVLEANKRYGTTLTDPGAQLRKASGYAFYNTSLYTFSRLLEDYHNLASNLRAYINGFSQNMHEVIEKFDFDNTIKRLDEEGLLFPVMERFAKIDLHPDTISNHAMGSIFEELIRKFNEALNENPGEHFTPRDVVLLMVFITLAKDADALTPGIVRKIYDPCCGTGGILTTAKENILKENPAAQVWIYGQEVNPETFAICKSDLYMKSESGQDAERIFYGSTLSNDRHLSERFHHIYANPPYGKDWKRDEQAIKAEADKGKLGRFEAGTPRISDGQLLFLQHMLSHMYDPAQDKDTSHVAIVMNGSPLFTGDAGSGESEIRRWILENDWLEAIIALPEQLFYNTGIATYIWILTNRKPEERKGKVQLINATDLWVPMRKSLGDKRRQISVEQAEQIRDIFINFSENERSKIFSYKAFGYRKILVERPLRLNFQLSPERIERLRQQKAFRELAVSKKKKPEERAAEEEAGRREQERIIATLSNPPATLFSANDSIAMLYKNRPAFERILNPLLKTANVTISLPLYKAIMAALSERDETAEICRDKKGRPEPDPDLRDSENVPLPLAPAEEAEIVREFYGEEIQLTASVDAYFQREVLPYVPDAWISKDFRDEKDGRVGKIGYEINFNRYFYQYQPPRPLAEIEVDIRLLEQDIVKMLREVAG
ncbi:MAG TPA: class I SAM-dependent DNA methyltransferase [Ktedonobacteraceae bacterium]|nr:class I SAM-dependent DNA methyltransferase [Ktedonobacteraceae bacterium]